MDKQHADSLVVPPRQALVSVRSPQPPRQWLPGKGHLRNLCLNDSNDAVVDVLVKAQRSTSARGLAGAVVFCSTGIRMTITRIQHD